MITLQGLTKYYDGFCAVDNIDLDIDQGEIVGLLGPNGAGKTTTLRILTGYLKPSSGSVQIKGLDLDQDMRAIKQTIGYLPESAPLYRNMLVYDYLTYLARVRNIEPETTRTRIRELARTCGMTEIMHKPIGELSRGLKQRVGLAHALLHDPEILILDEPTSGLDPNQIQEIRSMIRHIGREKTVILSTHILSEAEATCDRMVIIHQGRIAADGTPEGLKQGTAGSSSINLTLQNAQSAEITERLKPVQGVLDVQAVDAGRDGQVQVQLSCERDADPRAAVYQAVKDTDWILLEMSRQTQTLETIFKELTQEN